MKKLFGVLAALLLMTGVVAAEDYGYEEDYYYEDDYYEDDYYYEEDYYEDGYYYDPECVYVMLNGGYIWFDNQDACEISGSIFVPMREMFEEFGAEVLWDNETKTATGILGDKTVEFTIDSYEYKVNDETKTLPVPAQIKNGYTMLPVRALSESLGAEVYWNDETKEVEISYLRPLNEDEQYLYDLMTKKDIPVCEQTGTFKMSMTEDDADMNLSMNIKTIGDSEYSYSVIDIDGDIFRKVFIIDANIELWTLLEDNEVKMYASVNGSETDDSIMDFVEDIIPGGAISVFSDYEQNAVYNMFNNLEITSLESKNGQKIISFEYTLNEYTSPMSAAYYVDEKTNLPVKIIMDMSSTIEDMPEEMTYEISPIEINIKYNVKMPEKPDFLK